MNWPDEKWHMRYWCQCGYHQDSKELDSLEFSNRYGLLCPQCGIERVDSIQKTYEVGSVKTTWINHMKKLPSRKVIQKKPYLKWLPKWQRPVGEVWETLQPERKKETAPQPKPQQPPFSPEELSVIKNFLLKAAHPDHGGTSLTFQFIKTTFEQLEEMR